MAFNRKAVVPSFIETVKTTRVILGNENEDG
jgi:hypothetical protein